MSWKKIISLTVVLLLLIAAIIYVNQREKRQQIEEGKLLDISAAKIAKIELRQKERKFIFSRKDTIWYLQEPLVAKADKVALESIIDDFCPLKYDRLVEENARNLKNYGLDQPEIELKFFEKDQPEPMQTIMLGMKNSLDASTYTKLAGSGKVVLIAAYKRNTLEKDLFAFRDKKILTFDSLTVTALDYRQQNADFSFLKKDNQWFMAKPIFSLLQEGKVSDILSKASLLEAKSFKGPASSASLRECGLENPLLTVVFKLTAGTKKITVGKKGEQYFTMADSSGEICEIDRDFCETFSSDPSSLREKKIAVFPAFDVREFQFKSADFAFAIRKNQDNSWQLLKPAIKNRLDEEKINQFLMDLADCEAKEFIDGTVTRPVFVTLIKMKVENSLHPGQLQAIALDFSAAQEETAIARNPALPYLFKVGKEILEKLPRTISAITVETAPKSTGQST